MFNISKSEKKPEPVDVAIEHLVTKMADHEGFDEKYEKMAASLKVLCEAKAALPKQNKLSADVAAAVGANLVGIFMIMAHERTNVITTKALGFVFRPRT